MEKKLRYVHVMAHSNFGTDVETYHIEHIDSISHLHDMDK